MKKIVLFFGVIMTLTLKAQTVDTITASFPGSAIYSGYSTRCDSGGCTYNLPIVIPPGFIISKILYSFDYSALGTCQMDHGCYFISLGSCITSSRFCALPLAGICQATNLNIDSELTNCLPQTCTSDTLNFVLHFINKYSANNSCQFSCITSNSLWQLSIIGVMDSCSNPLPKFSIIPDSNLLHHYIVKDSSAYCSTLNYDWNWGDESHDYTPTPSHTYADTGFYDICLTLTNPLSGCSGTYCDQSFHVLRTTNTMVYIRVEKAILTGLKPTIAVDFSLFPNPANDYLTILSTLPENTRETVTIVNVLGEVAIQSEIKNPQSEISISSLPAGIYFLQIKTESGVVVKKFVKQ